MHLDSLITDLSLVLIAASVSTLLMKKLNQPMVLGYIVAGFLISPNFQYLPTVIKSADISSLAEIGIIFLMFALGLEFSFKKIVNVGSSAFVTALTVMTAMILIGYSVGKLMGWATMDSIFLGGMLSMSSTMIILKAYEEYNLKQEKFAQLVLGTLVLEDIAGIFMLIILSTISVSQNVSGIELVSEIGVLLLLLVVWLIAGIYIIPTFLKKIDHLLNDELLIILSLGICMGMVIIANFIGFSSALGAFMAGSILAGTVKVGRIEELVHPIKDLFGAIFFVSVGMLIQPSLLVKYIGPIILITIVTIVGQMIFATLGMLFSGQSLKTAIRGGFSMVQIGEFSFIVATLGMSLGVISDFLYPVVVCVSVITSFTTPFFIKNSIKVYDYLERKLPKAVKLFIRKNTSDNQLEDDKDQDWKIYLKKIGMRTFIGATAMFAIYWFGVNYIQFWFEGLLGVKTGRYVTAGILVLLMVPFVAIMHGTSKVLFTKLWVKHRSNRLPLLTLRFLRILLASMIIAMTLTKLLNFPFMLMVILSFSPAYMVVKSDYIRGRTKSMEISFVANLYERTLAKMKKEQGFGGNHHWLDESLKVVEFEIVDHKDELMVKDIGRSPHVHVGVIKVIRDGMHFNVPAGTFLLKKGDIIYTLGTDREIEVSLMTLEKYEYIDKTPHPKETLKNFIYGQTFKKVPPENQIICIPIVAKEESLFSRKSIKNSGIREKYMGSVIGLERNNLLLTHPPITTIIEPGDLIWIIGTNTMADKMIRDGILDEN